MYNLESDIFKENKVQFHKQSYENYQNIYISIENLIDLRLQDWIDLNRMTILRLEESLLIEKEYTKIYYELEKIIEEKILENGMLLKKIKSNNAMKNYYILGSIISQILTLLFLLILFKKILINNQKI